MSLRLALFFGDEIFYFPTVVCLQYLIPNVHPSWPSFCEEEEDVVNMAVKRGLCFAMAPGASNKKKKTAPLAAGLFDDPNADPPGDLRTVRSQSSHRVMCSEDIPPVRSVANATPAFDQFTTNEEAGRRKALGDLLAEQGR